MTDEYSRVFQDAAAVDKYEHVTYAPGSYAMRINDRQSAYLRALVRRRFGANRPVQHDFACGTGRAVRALQGMVREAHGYDTSVEMMAKAMQVGARAQWHEVAADGPVPTPVDAGHPAIVTMFRLMLNVGEDVRDRAVAFAARALPTADAGLLVVENHGNATSLRHLRSRRHAGRRWFAELSHDDIARHLRRHGFQIIERRGFTMLTPGCYQRPGLTALARAADATARLPGIDRFAVNVVYVAQRTTPTHVAR